MGGDTLFVDMFQAYDDLSDELKIKIKKAIDGTWEDYAKGGITKEEAIKEALKQGVDFEKDFHAQSKGNELIEIAKKQGYQKPKSASGSRGRYFFYYLQKEYDKNKEYGYYDDYAKGGYTSQNPPMSNEVYMELDRIKDWKIIKEKKHPSKRTNAVFTHSVAKDKDLYFGSGDYYRTALKIDGKIKYPIKIH